MVARGDLPVHNELFQLVSSTNTAVPVIMYRPDHIEKMEWVKYYDTDVDQNDDPSDQKHGTNLDIVADTDETGAVAVPIYKYVTILPVQQFLDYTSQFNTNDSNVKSFSFSPTLTESDQNFIFYYKTDITPQYCAVIQNYYVIFDSFDSEVDATLQSNKTMCFGEVIPGWIVADSFIPNLDDQQFPLLLNEAKSLAFYELKQIPHAKADQEIKRQWSSVQKNKALSTQPSYFDAIPDFGRRAWSGSAGEWFHTFRQKNNTW